MRTPCKHRSEKLYGVESPPPLLIGRGSLAILRLRFLALRDLSRLCPLTGRQIVPVHLLNPPRFWEDHGKKAILACLEK
jgi:hypothetical protein